MSTQETAEAIKVARWETTKFKADTANIKKKIGEVVKVRQKLQAFNAALEKKIQEIEGQQVIFFRIQGAVT